MQDERDAAKETERRQDAPQVPQEAPQVPQDAPKRKVHRMPKNEKRKEEAAKAVKPDSPLSDEAMERLARLMNDSPTIKKLKGTEWEIHALKPGTQWLIAETACDIVRQENTSLGDVIKQIATNMPAVCRCLTLALLNRKELIEGAAYQRTYDTLMWGDYDMRDWATLLFEVVSLLDVNFFFASTGAIQTVRTILGRKTRTGE